MRDVADPKQMPGGRGSGRPDAKWNQGDRNMLRIRKLIKNSKGATAIEYGLIAALIAVAAITAMQGLGTSIRTTFNNAASAMNG